MAEKVYAKNPAMIAVIRGRTKAIEDRLYDLERAFVAGSQATKTPVKR